MDFFFHSLFFKLRKKGPTVIYAWIISNHESHFDATVCNCIIQFHIYTHIQTRSIWHSKSHLQYYCTRMYVCVSVCLCIVQKKKTKNKEKFKFRNLFIYVDFKIHIRDTLSKYRTVQFFFHLQNNSFHFPFHMAVNNRKHSA